MYSNVFFRFASIFINMSLWSCLVRFLKVFDYIGRLLQYWLEPRGINRTSVSFWNFSKIAGVGFWSIAVPKSLSNTVLASCIDNRHFLPTTPHDMGRSSAVAKTPGSAGGGWSKEKNINWKIEECWHIAPGTCMQKKAKGDKSNSQTISPELRVMASGIKRAWCFMPIEFWELATAPSCLWER